MMIQETGESESTVPDAWNLIGCGRVSERELFFWNEEGESLDSSLVVTDARLSDGVLFRCSFPPGRIVPDGPYGICAVGTHVERSLVVAIDNASRVWVLRAADRWQAQCLDLALTRFKPTSLLVEEDSRVMIGTSIGCILEVTVD